MSSINQSSINEDQKFLEGCGISLLKFEQLLLTDSFYDDVLFISAKGLNIERIFINLLYLFDNPGKIIFIINTRKEEQDYLIRLFKKFYMIETVKILTANVSVKERQIIYQMGGLQFITSRILMVDILNDRVPIEKVIGIFVYHAHELLDSYQNAFILQLYREKQPNGVIKAFTDCPTNISVEIGRLQRLVNKLLVKKIILIPRFDSSVKSCYNANKPKFIQIALNLPQKEKTLRSFISDIIVTCVRDLKQCSQISILSDSEKNKQMNSLVDEAEFESDLRKKTLYLTDRQDRLLSDLRILRTLLFKVENLDPTNVWKYICAFRSEKNLLDKNSGWIFTKTASSIFSIVESLCFSNKKDEPDKITIPQKWNCFISLLAELREKINQNSNQSNVLVLVSNPTIAFQLMDLVKFGKDAYCSKLSNSITLKNKNQNEFVDNNANFSSLWNMEDVIYVDNKFFEKETTILQNEIENLQKKEIRKRSARKIIDPAAIDEETQTKLVNFGIIHYKEAKKKKLCLSNMKNSNQTKTSDLAYEEFLPKGMLPEDPFSVHYKNASASTSDVVISDTKILNNFEETIEITYQKIKQEINEVNLDNEQLNKDKLKKPKLIFVSLRDRYNIFNCLEEFSPSFFILYNVDIASTRIIETYNAHDADNNLEIFSLMYKNTAEEERYLLSLRNEQYSFEQIIREHGLLLIPEEYNTNREKNSYLRTLAFKNDSRTLNKNDDCQTDEYKRVSIIIDLREFQSELPIVLYKRGINIIPATIEIGDYVLSPEICVERKALDDLAQSLANGRIFKQIEQMQRHYKKSILLIESNKRLHQQLVNGGPFQGELTRRCRDIRRLLTILILNNHNLTFLWCSNPLQTAEIFEEITLDQPSPCLEIATSFRSDLLKDHDEENNEDCVETIVKDKPKNDIKINIILKRQLSFLPGVLAGDLERIMHYEVKKKNSTLNNQKSIKNLGDLVQCSSEDLYDPLLNKQLADDLVNFFKTDFRYIPLVT